MDDEDVRLYLHSLLETAYPDLGLYYRPSGNLKLDRPCIIYEPKASEPSYSNNNPYVVGTRFQVTILSDLPGYGTRNMFGLVNQAGIVIYSNTSYVSSDIVHDVFTLSVNSIT
jgi:hypothetical protein